MVLLGKLWGQNKILCECQLTDIDSDFRCIPARRSTRRSYTKWSLAFRDVLGITDLMADPATDPQTDPTDPTGPTESSPASTPLRPEHPKDDAVVSDSTSS